MWLMKKNYQLIQTSSVHTDYMCAILNLKSVCIVAEKYSHLYLTENWSGIFCLAYQQSNSFYAIKDNCVWDEYAQSYKAAQQQQQK